MTSQLNSFTNDTAAAADVVDIPQDEPQDELEMIKQELKPFAQALSEDIEKKPICKATAYEIAIAMIADIVIKILDYQEKKIIFPKKVITGLWSIQTSEDTSVNLIGTLYQFMTICGSYPDAQFKKSTYGSIISRKQTADNNYNLEPKQAYIPLKDCKFVLLLKVFRTIIAHSIKHTIGKYGIPNEADSDKWRYLYVDSERRQHFVTSDEFINYTLEMGQVYGELDKLSPQLSEIYEIFNEAAVASKLEKEQKMQRIEARTLYQKKSRFYSDEKCQQFVKKNTQSVQEKIDWKKIDSQIAPPSVWGKTNPVTHQQLPQFQPVVPIQQSQSAQNFYVTQDDDDGFQTVKHRGIK
jgi:hypothetical protein